jgi:protein required for attachment to host cells
MRARVVVADQSEARFYELQGMESGLRLTRRLTDAAAHLHNRDMVSDKPGRVFDHAPPSTGRRGGVGHHSTGGERSPRKHEAESFARTIIEELEKARQAGEFDSLIVMAGPGFLGLLRAASPKALTSVIAAEVDKDLVHQADAAIIAHVPWDELS